jgi:hypothetical protein
VAIGAPQQDSNRGAVYIYLGGKLGLSKQYSQMILAKDLNSQLLGFGSSFSLGIDIDKNDYNGTISNFKRSAAGFDEFST